MKSRLMNWTRLHTGAVVVVTAFFVWMAIRMPWGPYLSWIVTMAALTLFSVIVGHGVTGVLKGAFVDERKRMSLSRLQMLAWTIVVVSAFGTIVFTRLARDPSNAVRAMDIGVPPAIWILLGISTTSLIGSPLIKNTKKGADMQLAPGKEAKLLQEQGVKPEKVEVDGQIVKNRSIDDASLADLFMGEGVENAAFLDIGKIQMFLFTVLLLLAYGAEIASVLRSAQMPTQLPDVGDGMLPLIGISHAGYLMSKAASTTKPQGEQSPGGAAGGGAAPGAGAVPAGGL